MNHTSLRVAKRITDLNVLLGKLPEVPALDASPKEKMAYKLATEIGRAIYRLRTPALAGGARECTVEPVIGIIKEIMGFRQFSLRGLKKPRVSGVWSVWRSISSVCIS